MKPPPKDLLKADLYRYRGSTSRRAFLSAYLRDPGFRFTYYLRKVSRYSATRSLFDFLPYICYRQILQHYRFKYGFDISASASIGPGFYIGHSGGVVISRYAVLGSNVNIAHGVTIGATSRGARIGAPCLGDRVWVGANAIIVGKVVVGHDALIAPGAFVNFDVPAMSVVIGNPGTIVSNKGSVGYVNKILPRK